MDQTKARSQSRAEVVSQAMLVEPKICLAQATVSQVRELLLDDHVHAALVVESGRLLAVIYQSDLGTEDDETPARLIGHLSGRVVGPDADLDTVWHAMRAKGQRRLAVVDDRGMLLGLLCLKQHQRGFCSEQDVRSRRADITARARQTG